MAYRANKTDHSGPKRGRGFWGRKAEAKHQSSRVRRQQAAEHIRFCRMILCASLLIALPVAGCHSNVPQGQLTVIVGQSVLYTNPAGDEVTATYGSLSDNSLAFVKVQMPDGQEYTLPQVVSASGARYTDDRELVWWTKGATAFVQARDADGNWVTKYAELREVASKH